MTPDTEGRLKGAHALQTSELLVFTLAFVLMLQLWGRKSKAAVRTDSSVSTESLVIPLLNKRRQLSVTETALINFFAFHRTFNVSVVFLLGSLVSSNWFLPWVHFYVLFELREETVSLPTVDTDIGSFRSRP